MTGIILDRGSADIYSPKVIRSTMGSIYRVPFIYTDDLHQTIAEVKKQGIRLYAAHLKGKHNYEEENYTGPSGFLIGNEANGLTEETAALADAWVRIPMAGRLNPSMQRWRLRCCCLRRHGRDGSKLHFLKQCFKPDSLCK